MSDSMQERAVGVVQWVADHGIDGVTLKGVEVLASARSLAETYQNDPRYADDEARLDGMMKWEAAKNFGSGFVTSVGGLATLPATVAGSIDAASCVATGKIARAVFTG